jgi:hypothetical protein
VNLPSSMNETYRSITPPILQSSPRKNFSNTRAGKRTESNFAISFARTFLSNSPHRPLVVARELSVNGYGIADLVCLMETRKSKRSLFAFEIKMSDWRKGLSQAYRYKYFADCAVVVLPMVDAGPAELYISTFRALGVGLWLFDKGSDKIRKTYTPRSQGPLNPSAKEKALLLLRISQSRTTPRRVSERV